MKLDIQQTLFLTKVLFHYEQLIGDFDLKGRVRELRSEFNRELTDKQSSSEEDNDEDADEEQEVDIDYDLIISPAELKKYLPALNTRYDGKLSFVLDGKDEILNVHSNCDDEPYVEDVLFVKRTGKTIEFLTRVEREYLGWDIFEVNKFPPEWIDNLECGKIYKCS